jgi:mannose-6-phosphate isomerase
VHLLRGAVRTYAWVRGPHLPSPPEDPVPQRTPEAELWLGTHPGDPARQVTDEGDQFLLDTLRCRPERTAGSDRPWSLRRHTALLDEGVGGR